jgi:peptidoglycan/xylan/chitin deacetylase (PgdA/CDA1 family)
MEAISLLGPMLLGGAAASAALYTIGADLMPRGGSETVRRGPEDRHAVALTFDDGPDPVFTPRSAPASHCDRALPGIGLTT